MKSIASDFYKKQKEEALGSNASFVNLLESVKGRRFSRKSICGASSKDGFTILEVDHIVAFSNGGLTEMDNLATSCSRCNSGKSNKVYETNN